MSGVQPLNRFDLDKHPLIDKQINPKRGVEAESFENNIDWALTLDPVS